MALQREGGRQLLDEMLIDGGFRAQTMVHVHHAQNNAKLISKLKQSAQQGNRIRAAGDSRANTVSRPQEMMISN
jgi:hypothetical protein